MVLKEAATGGADRKPQSLPDSQERWLPLSDEEREALVSSYFEGYVDAGSHPISYALRHPAESVRAFRTLLRLPLVTAALTRTPGGRDIWIGLAHGRRSVIRTPVHALASLLKLPGRPEEYALGRHRQTLRRKCRAAEKRGVRWALVVDDAERERLADLANERDRTHPRDEFRVLDGDNRRLLVHPLWLAAYAADGRPILVSITPTDGEWALLQYFRTLEESPEASDARYLVTRVLAEELIRRGVRYLADNSSPMGIGNGLRQYQRMLGFRIFRIRRRWLR